MTPDDFRGLTLEDYRSPEIASEFLSILLRRQELTLLLGAGVSRGIGLPGWTTLVARCEEAAGLDRGSDDRSSDELMRSIDTVRREVGTEAGLVDVVRRCLYADLPDEPNYPDSILQQPMLIAVGALVMASSRGSVGDVFTLNFDDVLEWYLHLHGYRTQVVADFPARLRGDVDVTTFHFHGFVPFTTSIYPDSEGIVFSRSHLVERLSASADHPWPTLLGSRFLSKRFLALGTSMSDIDIDVHLRRASGFLSDGSPLGFVVDSAIPRDRQEDLLEAGVVPVSLADLVDIPPFVLGVCQRAAATLDTD